MMTDSAKWDGIGFSFTKDRLYPLLMEFSGGVQYNNNESKESKDLNKLVPGAIKSIEHACAITDMSLPIP